MTEGTTAAAQAASSSVGDAVAVRLPATSGYLSVLRSVTAGLAARLDFTLDEIEDLRIAVDEACAMLLARPEPGGELECEFILGEDRLHVYVTAPTLDGAEPQRDTFAWSLLTALAGEAEAHTNTANKVSIVLRKQRGAMGQA